MMLANLLGQPATILRPAKIPSGYGSGVLVDDWTNPTTQAVTCRLQLRTGTEKTDLRDVAIGQWVAYLPPEAVISEHDRLQVDGKTFEVITVYPVHRPSGLHHHKVTLETYSGEVATGG